MNKKRLDTIQDYLDELQDKIELLEKQFGNVHPIYEQMGGLIRSLRVNNYEKKAFLKEIEDRLATGQISRREVLILKGVDMNWCLDCGHGESKEFTKKGYCSPCEKKWKGMTK